MKRLKIFSIASLLLFPLPVMAEQNYLFPPTVIVPVGEPYADEDAGDGLKAFASSTDEMAVGIFQLSKYEITAKQFRKFMEDTKYQIKRDCRGRKLDAKDIEPLEGNKSSAKSGVSDIDPVVCVERDDILAYLAWASKKNGRNYRLASEAQWEYNSRVGSRKEYFPRRNEKKLCPYENNFSESEGRSFERGEGVNWSNMDCNDDMEYNTRIGRYRSKAVGQFDAMSHSEEKDQGRPE